MPDNGNAPQNTQAYFIEVCLVLSLGANREIKSSVFPVMWYIGKRPRYALGAFDCLFSRNSRLPGGLEVIQLYNDAFEDEAEDEFDRE